VRFTRDEGARHLKTDRYIFDTGPLLLYFGEDARVKKLLDAAKLGKAVGSTCELNLAELYYKTCEKLGRETARIRYLSLRRYGLNIVPPNENLSRLAGELKCKHRGRLSLVDAYVVALALTDRAILVTSDSQISGLVPTQLLKPL
jgi:predicted nucleic acid-binding protein